VIRVLPKFALVCALACSIGLHWAFWQAVAWTNMVASYSRDATLAEALTKTFDGKHPCALCKQIAEGKRTEKKSEQQNELKKFEFPCASANPALGARIRFGPIFGPLVSHRLLIYTPPLPPPRFLA
jgi:hypothetical protein